MALWRADNFTIYGTNQKSAVDQMTNGVYAAVERGSSNDYLYLDPDPDGISSGRVLAHYVRNGNNPASARTANPSGATDEMGVACRLWYNKLPGDNNYESQPIQFLNNASGVLLAISFTSTGQLRVSSTIGQVAITASPVITANGWWHIEMYADQTNVEVRVESQTVIGPIAHGMTTPQYAQNRSRTDFGTEIGTGNTDLVMYIKDLVCYDGLGTYNTSFLGTVLVVNLNITSDVALNWTPSTGTTGWQILDDIPPNNANYISAEDSPLPSPYIGTLSDLPADVTSIKGLITLVRAAKSDSGDGSIQNGLISDPSGTPATALGTDRPITMSQTYWQDVFEIDPKTSLPWVPSAVNDAQIRINRTL